MQPNDAIVQQMTNFFSRLLKKEDPNKIIFEIHETNPITNLPETRKLSPELFFQQFQHHNHQPDQIRVVIRNNRPKNHQMIESEFLKGHDSLGIINEAGSNIHNIHETTYSYVSLTGTTGETIDIYFPQELSYPIKLSGEYYHPLYEYHTDELHEAIGTLSEKFSVLIGRYYEVSEKLAYFLFDPSENADPILVIDYDNINIKYFHQPDMQVKLCTQDSKAPTVNLVVAPLSASIINKHDSYHENDSSVLFNAFVDFWARFSLWPKNIHQDELPQSIRALQKRQAQLTDHANTELKPDQSYCLQPSPTEVDQFFKGINQIDNFYQHKIEPLHSEFPSKHETLTLFIPKIFHFFSHQPEASATFKDLLDWRTEYCMPRIANLICTTPRANPLSIFMGNWIRDLNWFFINESEKARHLLIIEKLTAAPNSNTTVSQQWTELCEKARIVPDNHYTTKKSKTGQKIYPGLSQYTYMVVDLNSFSAKASVKNPIRTIYRLYCNFLAKYNARPVTVNQNDIEKLISRSAAMQKD